MNEPRVSRSLQLTGLADVRAVMRRGRPGDTEPVGLLLMLISAAAFALMAAFAKKLLPDTPTQAVVLSRGVMMSAVFLIAARWRGASICVETGGTDSASEHLESIEPQRFYLIRTDNDCPGTDGELGSDSFGTARTGRICP